jgi:hypothetical protein
MHEVSTRRCARVTGSLHWIGTKLCDPPMYDGLTNISLFVKAFELHVPKQQRLLALDVVLKATPARWWAAHKEGMEDWLQCQRLMNVRLGIELENNAQKYIGISNPTKHVEQCKNRWSSTLKEETIHRFIHTLDTIPKNWYLELEMRREKTSWDKMV